MDKKIFLIFSSVIILIFAYFFKEKITKLFFLPRDTSVVTILNQKQTNDVTSLNPDNLKVVADNLSIPWEIVFLPSGDMLVTERAGRLLKIGKETKVVSEIQGVKHIGEGGLLGIALHPNFLSNNYLYLYFTYQDGNQFKNKVERYVYKNDSISGKKVIIDNILGSIYHDGGKLAFGPDGYLYITTGDAQKANLAQDKNSVNGKILRIKDDGGVPSDNPFGNAVYSIGHRNPQGLTWDDKGNLWSTEHGPTGASAGNDEINLIVKGGNYGWPLIKGSQTKEGMISPVIESTTKDTWAPAGVIYLNNNLYFAGLRGSTLYKAKIDSANKLSLSPLFKNEFGRLRTVVIGPDKFIYITTSNKDGRGTPKSGDDKIIQINPKLLN